MFESMPGFPSTDDDNAGDSENEAALLDITEKSIQANMRKRNRKARPTKGRGLFALR